MKYSELERKLKELGCYFLKNSKNGHPIWINPRTKDLIKMGHHKNKEVAEGTLAKILRQAKGGLEG